MVFIIYRRKNLKVFLESFFGFFEFLMKKVFSVYIDYRRDVGLGVDSYIFFIIYFWKELIKGVVNFLF